MYEAVGMNASDIKIFEKRLQEMRAKLLGFVQHEMQGIKEEEGAKGYSQHNAEESTEDFNQQLSLQITDQERKILQEIDRALEKMQEGTYGICDLSGEEIPRARLEALPYANLTVQSKSTLERKR